MDILENSRPIKKFATLGATIVVVLAIGFFLRNHAGVLNLAGSQKNEVVVSKSQLEDWIKSASLKVPVGYEPMIGSERAIEGGKVLTIGFFPVGYKVDPTLLQTRNAEQIIPKDTTGIILMHFVPTAGKADGIVHDTMDQLAKGEDSDLEVEVKEVSLPKGNTSVGAIKQYANRDGNRLLSYFVPVAKDTLVVAVGPRNRFNHDSVIPYLQSMD